MRLTFLSILFHKKGPLKGLVEYLLFVLFQIHCCTFKGNFLASALLLSFCEHICQGNQASTVFSLSPKTNNAISCNFAFSPPHAFTTFP